MDFDSTTSVINHCSYYSLMVASELLKLGLDSEIALIQIEDNALNSTSPLKEGREVYHNHNVVIYNGMVIDITRRQFGDLIHKDIMPLDRYLSVGWVIKKKTKSSSLNLKSFN